MHCVSERYAFLPNRLRKEKQGGEKGINHEGRIQQKRFLNCFSTPMWWYNAVCSYFSEGGRSPATFSESGKNGKSSDGQSLQMDKANKAGNEETVNGETGRADG